MKRIIIMLAVCICNCICVFAQSENWKLYKSEYYSFLYPDTWTIQKLAEPKYDVVCVSNDRINGYNMQVSILVEKTQGLTYERYWRLFAENMLLNFKDHIWETCDWTTEFLTGEARTIGFISDKSGRDLLYLNLVFWKDDIGYVVTLNSLPFDEDDERYYVLYREEGLRILSSFQIP